MGHATEKIILDVGGTQFTTSMATLRSPHAANSWFGPRFSGQFGDTLRGNSIFIDRDPAHFGKILNFLRDGFCVLPNNLGDLRELWHEADFYSLQELKKLIEKTKHMQSFFSWSEDTAFEAVSERERERDMELLELKKQAVQLEEAWKLAADRVCSSRMRHRNKKLEDKAKNVGMSLYLALENITGPRLAQLATEVLLEHDEKLIVTWIDSKEQLNLKIDELSMEYLQILKDNKSNKGKHGKGGKKGGKNGKSGKGSGHKGGKKGGDDDTLVKGCMHGRSYQHPGRVVPVYPQRPRSLGPGFSRSVDHLGPLDDEWMLMAEAGHGRRHHRSLGFRYTPEDTDEESNFGSFSFDAEIGLDEYMRSLPFPDPSFPQVLY